MFSGMTNHSIDAKGRIVLPAKFREQLGETYYLARGFGNKCIQVMSSEQFNAMCEKIIPQSLREFAEIEGDAVVIGMTNRLEIWSKKNYEDYVASQNENLALALKELKL